MGVIAGYEETYLKHLECCLSCCIINAGVTSFCVDKTQVKPHQHVTNFKQEILTLEYFEDGLSHETPPEYRRLGM